MASISKRGGKYWVRWSEGSPRRNRSLTVATSKEAKALKVEIEAAIVRDGYFLTGRQRVAEATTMDEMMAAYLEHSMRVHKPRTTVLYGQHLGQWARFLRDGTERPLMPHELSYDNLSRFHLWLRNPVTGRHIHSRTESTARKIVQAVELLWKWCFQRQQRGTWTGVPYPDSLGLKALPPKKRKAPTWAQMDACVAAANDWHRRVAVLMRCTGLRVSQVMGMRWEDLDLEVAVLHVRPELGKSTQESRGRIIPIAPVLVEELAGWGRRDGYVVEPPPGTNAAEKRAYRARDMNRAWTRADVDPAVWKGHPDHTFRSGFQSGLKRLGADDEAVEYLVGHSRGIREHYVDPDAIPLRSAVALVPRFEEDDTVVALDVERRERR